MVLMNFDNLFQKDLKTGLYPVSYFALLTLTVFTKLRNPMPERV